MSEFGLRVMDRCLPVATGRACTDPPNQLGGILTLLALYHPHGVTERLVAETLDVKNIKPPVTKLRAFLRDAYGLDPSSEPILRSTTTHLTLNVAPLLEIDAVQFRQLVEDAGRIVALNRNEAQWLDAWKSLERALELWPADDSELLPALGGNGHDLREDLRSVHRKAVATRGMIALTLLGTFPSLAIESVETLFDEDRTNDRIANYATRLALQVHGERRALKIVNQHMMALRESSNEIGRDLKGLEQQIINKEEAAFGPLESLESSPTTDRLQSAATWTFSMKVEFPAVTKRVDDGLSSGHIKQRPGLQGDWFLVAFSRDSLSTDPAAWSMEFAESEEIQPNVYAIDWSRVAPKHPPRHWSSIVSDGSGIPSGVYGSTGSSGGFGHIQMWARASGYFEGVWLEHDVSSRGPQTIYRLEGAPMAFVRSELIILPEIAEALGVVEMLESVLDGNVPDGLPPRVQDKLDALARLRQTD